MAKVGKGTGEHDPFQSGGGIGEALHRLKKSQSGEPQKDGGGEAPPAKKGKARSPASKEANSNKRKGQDRNREQKTSETKASRTTEPKAKTVPVRFKALPEEAAEYDKAVLRMNAALGATVVDFSKLVRAALEIYLRHEEDILRNVPSDRTWKRPSTSNAMALAALDRDIADIVNEGMMIASRRPANRQKRED